ncbi:hypothetical protein ACIQXI_04570 [Lysinibacillus sp. NPDC097195]|uniref:hypothetical protein n=1 Tax=Lysinibacillus sp. NPDC097195 TaxID=3364141 RepID=UPI003827532C
MEDNRYCKHMNWDYYEVEMNGYDNVEEYKHNEKKCHKHEDCKQKHPHCSCKKEECWKEDRDTCKEMHCKGCICHLLRCFEIGSTVDVYLSSGGSFLGVVFIKLDNRNCCAYFVEAGAAAEPIIIDCQKIEAIRRIATV